MKRSFLIFTIFFVFSAIAFAQDGSPVGWTAGGSKPADFEIKPDTTVKHGGTASACLCFIGTKVEGNGVLLQQFKADAYRGKRLRMSAWVKTATANDIAQLWFRVDTPNSMPGFDNMGNRPIKGVSDWKRYELVLDVPNEAINLAFGVMSFGSGRVWVDDFAFEIVGTDVAETDPRAATARQATVNRDFLKNVKLPAAPSNLDFESGATPVRQPVAINPKVYDDYVGLYQIDAVVGGTKREGDKLMFQMDDGNWQPALPLSETEFFFKGMPGSMHFVKDTNGNVTEIVANLMGGERRLKRIDLAAAKPRGAEIMAAAYVAKGGLDKLKTIHNVWHDAVRMQGSVVTHFDLYLSNTIEFSQITRDLKGRITDQSISDGKRRWLVNGLNVNESNADQFAAFARNMQLLWFEAALLPLAGKTMEVYALADSEFEGKPVESVVAAIGDDNYVLSFDKQTHLLRRIKTITSEYSYDNYFDVNGLKMAGDAWIGFGSNKRHVKISKYKFNEAVDPARLAPPSISDNSPEAQAVLKQEEAWQQARAKNDLAALELLVAEGYLGLNQYGERRDKAAFLQLFAPGSYTLTGYKPGKSIVRVNGDQAVVTGDFVTGSPTSQASHQLFMRVWIKRDGRWQLLTHTQFDDPNKK